jgi:hypothetical protein
MMLWWMRCTDYRNKNTQNRNKNKIKTRRFMGEYFNHASASWFISSLILIIHIPILLYVRGVESFGFDRCLTHNRVSADIGVKTS